MFVNNDICTLLERKYFLMSTFLLKVPQYHFINSSLTWYEAQNFCRMKYSDLATVNSMNDKNKLVNTLGSHVTHSWIGLYREGTRRWMWSDGRGRADFTMWLGGKPSNSGNEWCGELYKEGSWKDVECIKERSFVCYERPPFALQWKDLKSTFAVLFMFVYLGQEEGEETYVHYSDKLSWMNSQDVCRIEHTDMAYVSTEADNSEIVDLASSSMGAIWLPNTVWIGLFNDAWMWSDGSDTSFRYWTRSTQYGGNCASVAASEQGRWSETQCNEKATFVCQGGLKVKKMVIRMKVRSDVDLTDSTVSEALLKKLETLLKHQQMTDFNLSWRSDKNGIIFRRQEELEAGEKTGC
ncbi:macrophage mannose receptor 1-like [Morone saxatilis]|uniref:macrophage mannose receptor 1-like n=1 Tax=Morone saxatilis TaxID=34816 RepID=UPI0015E212DB|nr:macrophage mannose receptor 1-like [Morone saxatilis]